MAGDNKTEQATARRRQKAREKGQIARSRELPSALALCATLGVLAWTSAPAIASWRELFQISLNLAARGDLRLASPISERWLRWVLVWMAPALGCGCAVAVLGCLLQGGIVVAPGLLAPKADRFSPAHHLRQMFSLTALGHLLKTQLPFAAVAYSSFLVLSRDWGDICGLVRTNSSGLAGFLGSRILEIGWRSGLILLVWAAIDYWFAHRKLESDLRMSRDEIREELKESEGHPTVKMRIRRLQRQARRRRMLDAVKTASVVATNPTHFAVALLYRTDMMAPMVVAKGRNLLAQQIKEIARWHDVPIIENPPLAQALYRTAEVGQVIPAKLYAAVAELLAFIYRAQQQAARSGKR